MLRYSKLSFIALILTFLIGGSFLKTSGQPIWLDRSADKAISLEILKPNFADEEETTFSTSAWFLSGRFAAGNTVSVVGQIPFAIYGRDDNGSSESYNAFGNIYAGIEIHYPDSPAFAEIGVYLPTASGEGDDVNALQSGLYTEWVDRLEAFAWDIIPVNLMINFYQRHPGGLLLRFRLGPSLWIKNGDDFILDETEVFMLYTAQVGYAAPKFELLTGFGGRWWATAGESAENFGEASWHQLGFSGNIALGNFRPGITFRAPIDDDYSELMDFVFGLTLGFNLP